MLITVCCSSTKINDLIKRKTWPGHSPDLTPLFRTWQFLMMTHFSRYQSTERLSAAVVLRGFYTSTCLCQNNRIIKHQTESVCLSWIKASWIWSRVSLWSSCRQFNVSQQGRSSHYAPELERNHIYSLSETERERAGGETGVTDSQIICLQQLCTSMFDFILKHTTNIQINSNMNTDQKQTCRKSGMLLLHVECILRQNESNLN